MTKLTIYPEELIKLLGRKTDKEIAALFLLEETRIYKLRKKLGIKSYRSTRIGTYVCQICKKEFKRWKSQQERKNRTGKLYCSTRCSGIAQSNKVTVNCNNCGKEISIRNSQSKSSHHFCNKSCEFIWKRGENHPNYHGGYHKIYGRGWKKIKKLVNDRDKQCLNCGAKTNLDTHHIIPFCISKDNSLDNLITLCKSCHSSIGNIYWNDIRKPEYFARINECKFKNEIVCYGACKTAKVK